MNRDALFRSFIERRGEADSRARAVLDEFIRLARRLDPDALAWREVASLNESWRDTLSDSQVIRHLRSLRPRRKERRSRTERL